MRVGEQRSSVEQRAKSPRSRPKRRARSSNALFCVVWLASALAACGERATNDRGPAQAVDAEPRPPRRPPRLGAAAHLPYPAFEGWTMARDAEVYRPEQVAQLDEQSVEELQRFGLTGAAAAEYRNDALPEAVLRLEIFDMGSRLNAFGYLATQIATLPDPTDAQNLFKVHGRGIMLMKLNMDEVRFNERGNEIVLIKRAPSDRDDGRPEPGSQTPNLTEIAS